MAGAVKVDDSALLGALAAFKALPKDLQRETARATKSTLTPLWRKIIATRMGVAEGTISARQDALAGPGVARFTVGGKGTLAAYTRKEVLSGGLSNATWWAVEFGSTRPGYSGSRLPRRKREGRIGYKGVKSWAPAAQRVYLGVLMDVLRERGVEVDGG